MVPQLNFLKKEDLAKPPKEVDKVVVAEILKAKSVEQIELLLEDVRRHTRVQLYAELLQKVREQHAED